MNLWCGFIFKKGGIVLYGYIDRDLAPKQSSVYLPRQQGTKGFILRALTHCQLQNLQELSCVEDHILVDFIRSDPVRLSVNQKTRSRSRGRKCN